MKQKNIVFLGDWHIRNREDANRISNWLKDHINPKTDTLILMGDLIDTGLDRGMGWDQDSVNQQLIYLKKILDRYSILGYILGNHERRIWIKTGMNPYQMIYGDETTSYQIEIKTKSKLSIGKIDIDVILNIEIEHGRSAAHDPTLELSRLQQAHPYAYIVALGHSHDLGIYALPNGVIGIRTGTLQEYPDYARRSIMIPKTQGCIRYVVDEDRMELVI